MMSPDDLLNEMLAGLLAVVPAVYLGSLVHEPGHALFGRWGGFRVTSFGMGTARPFWVRNLPDGLPPFGLFAVVVTSVPALLFGFAW
jgi:hypothetical protein